MLKSHVISLNVTELTVVCDCVVQRVHRTVKDVQSTVRVNVTSARMAMASTVLTHLASVSHVFISASFVFNRTHFFGCCYWWAHSESSALIF